MFKHAYRERRCLIPVNGFFEWKAIKGSKSKQPYAIALTSGEPFCLAGIYSERKNPEDGTTLRTFCIITCEPNQLMATIHDRMPVILHRKDYERWLGDEENPADLMRPFPADHMTMWPIDRKVGKVSNNTPDIVDPLDGDELDF
jgi:putative SOS response-associated peptidase YedK